MPNQHKHPNLSFRPPADDRAWLLAYVERTGRPRNAILAEALAQYRARVEASRKQVEQQDTTTGEPK